MRHLISVFVVTATLAASSAVLVACSEEVFDSGINSNSDVSHANRLKDYDTARKVFWKKVYPQGGETLYCGRPFLPTAKRNFNIEHVFPMSWVTNALDCGKRKQCRAKSAQFNKIEADLHNLFPARTDVNRARDSFRFGEIQGESRDYGQDCDFETDWRRRMAEPRNEVRGDIARAMFYMADEYRDQGLEIFKKQAQLLARWHNDDPPSSGEVRRNDRIEKIQGNRNRFVDDPGALNKMIEQWY